MIGAIVTHVATGCALVGAIVTHVATNRDLAGAFLAQVARDCAMVGEDVAHAARAVRHLRPDRGLAKMDDSVSSAPMAMATPVSHRASRSSPWKWSSRAAVPHAIPMAV